MTDSLNVVFEATAVVTDSRTFEGLAVPYGKPTSDGRNVQFAAGAFGDLESQSLAAVLIQHPFKNGEKAVHVGRVTEWRDTEHGLEFSARLNESEAAEAIYAALKDGEHTDVSVGVYCSDFVEDEETGITTFNSASLLELSIITSGNGAFSESKITSVFAEANGEATPLSETIKENNMDNLETKVADLEARLEDNERSLSVFSDSRPSTPKTSKFSTFGQVVKGVAAGNDDAIAEMNAFAYTGGVKSQVEIQHAWAAPLLNVVNLGRPLTSLFNKLPDPGHTTIDYLKLGTSTINVAEQANEGDDLVYGKVNITSATASMKTYGGWFDWSQQAIDRADVNVVDLGYQHLASKYAEVTEAVVRSTFLGATGTTAVSGFAPDDYSKIVSTVIDAQTIFANRGKSVEFIVASPDVFKKLALANVGSNNDFVLNRDSGSVNVTGISATLFGIPVKVLPVGTNVFTFTNSSALTVWESGVGKLSDTNIVNLTNQFSLYGYMGVAVTDPTSIVRAVATGA